ncbi:MAG: hypothetical protein WDO06_09890 [Actinomycetota bacterium]
MAHLRNQKISRGPLKRLLKEIGEERKTLVAVLSLISLSVTIGAFGPKILGRATNEDFFTDFSVEESRRT